MSKTREVRPFGARDKFGYLFGDLANDFSFIFASTYVMVFYTKVMGISAAMVGTMFHINNKGSDSVHLWVCGVFSFGKIYVYQQ